MKTIILITILATFFSTTGLSCDCDSARQSIEDLLKKSRYTFVGTVKSIKPSSEKDIWTYDEVEFDVNEMFAGEEIETVKLYNEHSNCGQFFEIGKKYLVYVYMERQSKKLKVSDCFSPCFNVKRPEGKADLKKLRTITAKK